MAFGAFDDKSKPPGTKELRGALGKVFPAWEGLRKDLATRFSPLEEQWGFTKSAGWYVRLIQKKRTVVYLTPCSGRFRASFVLGEKAVKAARASDLPEAMISAIESAPKYVEGRGVRFEVRAVSQARAIRKLAEIKMAN